MMQEPKAKRRQTQNDTRVLHSLRQANRPMTAYQILDQLKKFGVSGPTTDYRALQRLVADGTVHRIEALNAYVVCSRSAHGAAPTFIICEQCNLVTELCDDRLGEQLTKSATNAGAVFKALSIEIRGTCAACFTGQPEEARI